jgi:hypothetical protein
MKYPGQKARERAYWTRAGILEREIFSFLLIKPQQNGMGRRLLWENSSSA